MTSSDNTIKVVPLGDYGTGVKTILRKIKYGPDFTESSINDYKFKCYSDLSHIFNIQVENEVVIIFFVNLLFK